MEEIIYMDCGMSFKERVKNTVDKVKEKVGQVKNTLAGNPSAVAQNLRMQAQSAIAKGKARLHTSPPQIFDTTLTPATKSLLGSADDEVHFGVAAISNDCANCADILASRDKDFRQTIKSSKRFSDDAVITTVKEGNIVIGAVVREGKKATVILAGTASAKDVLDDIKFMPAPMPGHKDALVHSGFLKRSQKMQKSIAPALEGAEEVHITGHSMGAATGSLLAIGLKDKHPNQKISLSAFAMPAAGNAAYGALLEKATDGKNIHIMLAGDQIPSLIPAGVAVLPKTVTINAEGKASMGAPPRNPADSAKAVASLSLELAHGKTKLHHPESYRDIIQKALRYQLGMSNAKSAAGEMGLAETIQPATSATTGTPSIPIKAAIAGGR